MIQMVNVEKRYGEVEALRGISTSIGRGEIVGLLGPNGAGKTTAMKILVGYLLPTAGSVKVGGIDVIEDPLAVQERIGYMPENAPVYPDMLVQEYLRFIARMRGLESTAANRGILRAVDECALGGVVTRPIGQLSKGYRQRVGLAAAMIHDPKVLILDEPTSGLDPNQIVEIRGLIRRMGERKTVILSTHILPEVEATCDRAVILIDGRIRADGRLDELTRSRVQVVTIAPTEVDTAQALLGRLPGVTSVDVAPAADSFFTFRLGIADGCEIGEDVARAVTHRGWPMRELRRDDKTLEQVFRELTEARVEVAA